MSYKDKIKLQNNISEIRKRTFNVTKFSKQDKGKINAKEK